MSPPTGEFMSCVCLYGTIDTPYCITLHIVEETVIYGGHDRS